MHSYCFTIDVFGPSCMSTQFVHTIVHTCNVLVALFRPVTLVRPLVDILSHLCHILVLGT